MLEFLEALRGLTTRHRTLGGIVVAIAGAGALALACQHGEGLEGPTRTIDQPIENFSPKPTRTFASCDALNQWNGVINNENVVFPAGCIYKGQVKFMSGDVTLDCNSSIIAGIHDGKLIVKPQAANGVVMNNPHTANARYYKFETPAGVPQPLLAGIVIGAPTYPSGTCRPDGPQVEDVTIRNCTVRGFYQGIRLDRQLPQEGPTCETPHERTHYDGYDPDGGYDEEQGNAGYLAEHALERTGLYNRSPKRVRIIDSEVMNNGHAGIYVTAYSQYFSIERTTVRDNGSVGIYLSHESRYNTIERSLIRRNGVGSNAAMYQVPVLGEEVEGPSREGIAIDSSAHNTVSHNEITENYKGGITLYKNCGEGHDPPDKPGTIRKMHSDYNRIVHNTIHLHTDKTQGDARSGFGIWLAMRQGQLYDTNEGAFAHCRDPQFTVNNVKYNHDYANFNLIAYNTFSGNWVSIRVSDDFNQIVGNQFDGPTKYDMYIGDTIRGLLAEPVRGTSIVKNRSWSTISGGGRNIVFHSGSGDQTFFKGDMYYERRVDSAGNQQCSTVGAPYNDCTRPPEQLLHGLFWD